MPTDITGAPGADPTKIESDTPLFAPIRTSKRGEKGSFFSNLPKESARRSAETRSFAETPVAATPATGARLDAVDPTETTFAAAPVYATTPRRNGALAPMAIAGGLVLLAGVAAAGWYASQPHDNGMAQLTPGSTSVTPVAPPADQLAQAPAPAPEPVAATPKAKPVATAKAEPAPRPARARAPSRAAEDQGVNASTIAPAPRPLTPAPVAPPVNPAPPQAAPAPAPTLVIPPPADTPLPTQTAPPSPPQQSPTPAPTQTPPQ